MLKAFSYTGRPKSSVLGKNSWCSIGQGKPTIAVLTPWEIIVVNSVKTQKEYVIRFLLPGAWNIIGKKTHFVNIERWEDKNIWEHTKTFYDESSASTWELSGKELLRGGGETEDTWKGEEEISSIQVRNCPELVLVRPISIFFSK